MGAKMKLYGSRWKLIDSCGEGGQGHVFKVKDISGVYTEICALKLIKNNNRIDRFYIELEAMKTLSHDYLMSIIDCSMIEGDADDKLFIVMPLMKGGDLSKRAASFHGYLDPVCDMGRKLAIGLQYMHEHRIIHRDIKPANILFKSEDNDPVIADFGICYIADQTYQTNSAEVVGSRFYTAPELENPDRTEPTAMSDVYSLGKVLYYLFTGKTIPREDLIGADHSIYFNPSIRQQMFTKLIERMLAVPELRIKSMDSVITEVLKIRQWDMQTGISLLSDSSLKHLQRTLEYESDVQRISKRNMDIVDSRLRALNEFISSYSVWLGNELKSICDKYYNQELFNLECISITRSNIKDTGMHFPQLDGMLQCHAALGLKCSKSSDRLSKSFEIIYMICCDARMLIHDSDNIYYEDAECFNIKIIPLNQIKTNDGRVMSRSFYVKDAHDSSAVNSFVTCDNNIKVDPRTIIITTFDVCRWPSCIESVRSDIKCSLEKYFDMLEHI